MLEKLQGIKQMGISATLADSETNNYPETPNCHRNLDMNVLEKLQGIKPIFPSSPSDNYKTNNYSETPNFHQNLDIIVFVFFGG